MTLEDPKEKVLTARAIEAVKRLRERGVVFCVTSGRPPCGLRMFVEPLELTIAMAAFNGGVMVRPDLSVIEKVSASSPKRGWTSTSSRSVCRTKPRSRPWRRGTAA